MPLRTRRIALATFTAALAVAGVVVGACGLDAVGEKPGPIATSDADTVQEDGPAETDGNVETEDTGTDAPVTVGACPSDAGPTMVPVGDAGLCIDSTEVTNAQYAAFVTATGGVDTGFLDGAARAQCASSVTFAQKNADAGGPNEPVTYVDWCDAYAYCIWAGKHLCTAAADGGGEWSLACTRSGQRHFPYGNEADASACNVGHDARAPVGSFRGCEGGYAGIFDMVGNAAEWVDDCTGPTCRLHGGSYLDMMAECATSVPGFATGSQDSTTGFRCCR